MIQQKNIIEKYNLPTEIRYCKKCTVSNQRPRNTFDENGVCNACNYAEFKRNNVDWDKREEELHAMCDRFRSKDGSYDVVVPSSGGKDSSYTAHQLKYKYSMHPLVVTWAPHVYTDIGFRNYQNSIHVGGFDGLLGMPDGIVHRKLTKLSFEILGEPFQPFAYGQINFPLQIAAKYKIPLVMYGENAEVEYGGNMKNAYKPARDWKKDHRSLVFSGLAPEDLLKHGVGLSDLSTYLAPSHDELEKLELEVHFLGYYKFWDPQETYYYCVKNTGFEPNPDRSEGTYSKYASLDDRLDGYHYYLMFIKFGIGRATSDTAHEIRDGKITREEGVALVRRFDGEFPQKHFKEFLEYCDISEKYFWEVVDSWRSPHLWEKRDAKWILKYQVE